MQHSLLLVLSLPFSALPEDGYRTPPQAVIDIVDAAPAPRVYASPDAEWMLLVERPALPSIEDVSRPWISLAGLRLDPVINARHRTSFDTGLVLRDRAGERETTLALPAGARIASVSWSHDSRHFGFTLVGEEGLELWVGTAPEGELKRAGAGLNGMFGSGWTWMPDGSHVLAAFVPAGRGGAPEEPGVPTGPTTMETHGDTSPLRTYQDLLANPHDEALFEYHGASRLAIIDPATLSTIVYEPALISSFEPSPDGKHLLVTRLSRPFSYLMPYWYQFPHRISVWEPEGREQAQLFVDAFRCPRTSRSEGFSTGPRRRHLDARASPATRLVWCSSRPSTVAIPKRRGGTPRPLVDEPCPASSSTARTNSLLETEHRALRTQLRSQNSRARASPREYDRDRRWTRSLTLHDLSRRDVDAPWCSTTARFATATATRGAGDGGRTTQGRMATVSCARTGTGSTAPVRGASPEGLCPFLDRQNLTTLRERAAVALRAGCLRARERLCRDRRERTAKSSS